MTPSANRGDAPSKMRVAAIQMTSSADVAQNLATAARLVAEAAAAGASLAVLPENFAFMGLADTDKLAVAEAPGDGPIQAALARMSASHLIWVVGGTIPLRVDGEPRPAASCLVYDDAGVLAARYDKMHLFDVDVPGKAESYRESRNTAPGTGPQIVATPAGRIGLAVCYDVRFPELFRMMSAAGVDGFVLPSAFTVPTGRAHWETLLRARAIENLAFVVAAAQWGHHQNGRDTYGDSLVVDHWGNVLARQATGEGVVVADIDAAAQALARQSFPALAHRRV
jgi:nitrilase